MNKTLKTILEYSFIIVIVVIIRLFIITPIEVNGSSMEKTLYDNDIMLLNIIGYKTTGIKRFDIVVIKYGNDHLIKRVIGLPGEKIEFINDKLYIDGEHTEDVVSAKTGDYSTTLLKSDGIIPENKYFVLGDNRGSSADSRIIGFIDGNDILGKTSFIIWPLKHFGKVK